MGIYKDYCYGCICDKCGEHFFSRLSGCNMFVDTTSVKEELDYDDTWHEIDGKWYCPNCCHYDEEKDEWVVNEEKED